MRITPEKITQLKPNEIFVFGSNLAGIHGAGAAKYAYDNFGAIWGKAYGLQGQSFAIPTKDRYISNSLRIDMIQTYVMLFHAHVLTHTKNVYYVTPIGCGYAGYKPEDIAPLFKDLINLENVYLPESFIKIITNESDQKTKE